MLVIFLLTSGFSLQIHCFVNHFLFHKKLLTTKLAILSADRLINSRWYEWFIVSIISSDKIVNVRKWSMIRANVKMHKDFRARRSFICFGRWNIIGASLNVVDFDNQSICRILVLSERATNWHTWNITAINVWAHQSLWSGLFYVCSLLCCLHGK